MLFILALQHQHTHESSKENYWQPQLFKEAIQNQSILLRESLLKQAKQMKKELKQQERLMRLQNNYEFENQYFEDESFNRNNRVNTVVNNNYTNISQLRNDTSVENFRRHTHHHHTHHQRRCKSKGINNLKLLEETKINDKTIIKNENKQCPICLDNYKIKDKISYLPCFHLYHYKCIKKWLKTSKICPLCKKEVNFNDDNK
jgi:hypothetical protein